MAKCDDGHCCATPCCQQNSCCSESESSESEEEDIQALIPEKLPEGTTLESLVEAADGHPLVLDFQYKDCKPCVDFEADFEAIVAQYPDVIFRAVDIYDFKDMRQQLGVSQVPSFKIWVNGVLEDTVVGDSKKQLEESVQKAVKAYDEEHRE